MLRALLKLLLGDGLDAMVGDDDGCDVVCCVACGFAVGAKTGCDIHMAYPIKLNDFKIQIRKHKDHGSNKPPYAGPKRPQSRPTLGCYEYARPIK